MKKYDSNFFIEYLNYLIKLNTLHSNEWNGRSLITPTLLSEELCKYLLNLEDREKGVKDYDAKKGGEKYEIKATSKKSGNTTYNPDSKVDYFIWIFFDYTNEELVIQKTEYKNIDKSKIAGNNRIEEDEEVVVNIGEIIGENQPRRESIQLNQIDWEETRIFCMRTLKELKK